MGKGKIVSDGDRIAVFGPPGVGKTSLIAKLTSNNFTETYTPTFVTTIQNTKLEFAKELEVRVYMFDLPGGHLFQQFTTPYLSISKVAILMYSVEDLGSFEEVSTWAGYCDSNRVKTILVANKAETSQKLISFQMGKSKAKEINAFFIETSVKTGKNIAQLSRLLSYLIIQN